MAQESLRVATGLWLREGATGAGGCAHPRVSDARLVALAPPELWRGGAAPQLRAFIERIGTS
jgi:hypothetical protein